MNEEERLITINAQNFDLSPTQRGDLLWRMGELYDLCPSDSSVTLDLIKGEANYTGRLLVEGQLKAFISTAEENSPLQLYLLLDKEISQSILEWKRNRF